MNFILQNLIVCIDKKKVFHSKASDTTSENFLCEFSSVNPENLIRYQILALMKLFLFIYKQL